MSSSISVPTPSAPHHLAQRFPSPSSPTFPPRGSVVLGKTCPIQRFENNEKEYNTSVGLLHGDAAFAGQGVAYEAIGFCTSTSSSTIKSASPLTLVSLAPPLTPLTSPSPSTLPSSM
ncbi:hypothetical protein NMY22_g11645 [Coprinellus aureogranulatus]|nr:hypothetical protein NMY22_g11645 [Coprinellus aureogranulatus]